VGSSGDGEIDEFVVVVATSQVSSDDVGASSSHSLRMSDLERIWKFDEKKNALQMV